MSNESLFNSRHDDPRFFEKGANKKIVPGRSNSGSFGIGPVNLAQGPLAAFRKQPGADANNAETSEEARDSADRLGPNGICSEF